MQLMLHFSQLNKERTIPKEFGLLNYKMINAKQEFLDHINERCVGGRTVRCAKISIHNAKNSVYSILPVGYTPEDQEAFLKVIDLDYDESYGEQELFGTIWYDDGITWSQRGEYDGREWYEFQSCPDIPNELQKGETE